MDAVAKLIQEADKPVLAYLKRMEADLELLTDEGVFPKDAVDSVGAAAHVQSCLIGAKNICWAMRTFPLLDISFLSRMKKERYTVENRNERNQSKEVEIWVPVFGVTNLQEMSAKFDPSYETSCCIGVSAVSFPFDLTQENSRAVAYPLRLEGGDSLNAQCPPLPLGVKRRVDAVAHRFEQVGVIFEAQWKPAPVDDPIVFGTIGHLVFVIDKYDLTQVERYIVSEMSTGPES